MEITSAVSEWLVTIPVAVEASNTGRSARKISVA